MCMNAGDVLKAGLTPSSYDLMVVRAAIHQFFEIEEMFAFMRTMLKPGGLLFFDVYAGPDHMRYEPDQGSSTPDASTDPEGLGQGRLGVSGWKPPA